MIVVAPHVADEVGTPSCCRWHMRVHVLLATLFSCHSCSRSSACCIILTPEDLRQSEGPWRVLDFPMEIVGTALLSTSPTSRRVMLFDDKLSLAGVTNRVFQPIQATGSQVLEVLQGRSRSA